MTDFGFPKNLMPSLSCVCGNNPFILKEDGGNGFMTMEGKLVCPVCGQTFFILNGIVDFFSVQKDLGINKDTKVEMGVRDKQAPEYDKRLGERFEREIIPTFSAMDDLDGKTVVEYGSGTGRLTVELKEAEKVLAIDISKQSLHILRQKLISSGTKNVGLVWADVVNLRLAPFFFDSALSAQVYEHISTFVERLKFLYSVKRTLKPSGSLVLSAYHCDIRRKFKRKLKEGHHSSGIFFHYFRKSEIKREISAVFPKVRVTLIDISLPIIGGILRSLHLEKAISQIAGHIPVIKNLAHLVLVCATNDKFSVLSHSSFFITPLSRKYWFWFTKPFEFSGTAMTNFLSYDDSNLGGFHKKKGLTSIIDLNQTLELVWSGMRDKFMRKQIEKGERNGIKVTQSSNFKEFEILYRKFRRKYSLPQDRVSLFKKRSFIFSAYYGGKLIAGGLFLGDGINMRAYALASLRQSKSGRLREIVGQANRMVIWEAIKFAHNTGHKSFDLGGINPNSPNPHQVSLAEFKEAFGGTRCENYYYYKVYSPILRLWMRFRGFHNI